MTDLPEAQVQSIVTGVQVGLLPVVFVGLILVICATLLIPWPAAAPGQSYTRLVPHWQRLTVPDTESLSAIAVISRVGDVGYYGLVLGGLACATWAALTARRAPWWGLSLIGLLGVAYTAGMVLYNGPLVAAPGFLMMLWAALLTLLAWPEATDAG